MTCKFLIIGGGIRLEKAKDAFIKNGHYATIYTGNEPLKTAIEAHDAIILGLPCSKDDKWVNTENDLSVSLRDVAQMCGKDKIVLGGKMSERVKALFDVYSVRWADYADFEEFEISNAVPTAEGAIQIAMEEFPFTIHSSRILITGFGKVAKALALRLKALGAHCTIIARKSTARAEAESLGFKTGDFSFLPEEVKNCDILFNTVPAKVIGRNVLNSMNSTQGIIDLASKPGGVDLDMARSLGINVIWALSLPGKVAPVSAGKIIQKTDDRDFFLFSLSEYQACGFKLDEVTFDLHEHGNPVGNIVTEYESKWVERGLPIHRVVATP